jgi:polyisoprenoid-binding protein YceI
MPVAAVEKPNLASARKEDTMPARLLCALILASAAPVAAAPRTLAIDPTTSSLFIHVGKTGIGSFAGHEHEVVALFPKGEVVADFDDVARSSLEVVVDARALTVVARGEPEGDAPQVEQKMKGPEVLDVARYPTILFRSQKVTGKPLSQGSYELTIAGEISLHGITRPVTVPLRVESRGEALTATGKFVVKQTDFGIEPVSAGGGLVKVEDEVTITLRINAQPQATTGATR